MEVKVNEGIAGHPFSVFAMKKIWQIYDARQRKKS
jgi:hypothetical protein